MKNLWVLILVAGVLPWVGCYVSSTTTVTELASLWGPSTGGDGKVLDPNLHLTCNYPTPCKVILRDSAGHKLFSHTAPAGKSVLTITLEHGNLVIKRASGDTLAKIPVSVAADAALKSELDMSSEPKPAAIVSFRLRIGASPSDPVFKLTVDPGGR